MKQMEKSNFLAEKFVHFHSEAGPSKSREIDEKQENIMDNFLHIESNAGPSKTRESDEKNGNILEIFVPLESKAGPSKSPESNKMSESLSDETENFILSNIMENFVQLESKSRESDGKCGEIKNFYPESKSRESDGKSGEIKFFYPESKSRESDGKSGEIKNFYPESKSYESDGKSGAIEIFYPESKSRESDGKSGEFKNFSPESKAAASKSYDETSDNMALDRKVLLHNKTFSIAVTEGSKTTSKTHKTLHKHPSDHHKISSKHPSDSSKSLSKHGSESHNSKHSSDVSKGLFKSTSEKFKTLPSNSGDTRSKISNNDKPKSSKRGIGLKSSPVSKRKRGSPKVKKRSVGNIEQPRKTSDRRLSNRKNVGNISNDTFEYGRGILPGEYRSSSNDEDDDILTAIVTPRDTAIVMSKSSNGYQSLNQTRLSGNSLESLTGKYSPSKNGRSGSVPDHTKSNNELSIGKNQCSSTPASPKKLSFMAPPDANSSPKFTHIQRPKSKSQPTLYASSLRLV